MPMTRLILMAVIIGLAGPSLARADMLCPDTANESDLAVKDMSDVQFDIDRLELCLQRAQLLQKIDETVKKREQLRNQPLGLNGSMSMGSASIPPMPGLPTLSADKIAMPVIEAVKEPIIPVVQQDWKIQRIWGQGSAMQSQLVRDDVIANVKVGDVLPTGERVAEVSVRGVILDSGSGRKPLVWFDNAKKETETEQQGSMTKP